MPLPRPSRDPDGYYARLGVEPDAGAAAIAAAYRRKARILHPDVPGTGDSDAFVALKQAYDVVGQAERRASYDRLAKQEAAQQPGDPNDGEMPASSYYDIASVPLRHPRWRDLPIPVWAGLAAVLLIGVIEVGIHLVSPAPEVRRETIPPNAREVAPIAAGEAAPSPYGPAPVRLAGTPNFYVLPGATPALLWREDNERHGLAPWGILPPFSAVQGLRLFRSNGMVEIKVTDAENGFMEAARLSPGDAAAGQRAWCAYNAGPTPGNGEVLARLVEGHGRLRIDNRSGQPAVVKFRTASGGLIASVFVGPDGEATVEGLPDSPVQLDFATGEAWSRACRGFAAGMRAQRIPAPLTPGPSASLTIPPDQALGSVDLSDQAFESE